MKERMKTNQSVSQYNTNFMTMAVKWKRRESLYSKYMCTTKPASILSLSVKCNLIMYKSYTVFFFFIKTHLLLYISSMPSTATVFLSHVGSSKLEWADYASVQAQCGNLSGNELTRNSSGNTPSQLSLLAEPLWTDPGLKMWNWCARADLHFKTHKKAQEGTESSNLAPKSSQARKEPPPSDINLCLSPT